MLGRSGKTANQQRRRHTRLPIGTPAIVSWDSGGDRRELKGSCCDLSEEGAGINLDEPVPVSTSVHLNFPELRAEADGVVRREGESSIGIEFTDLVYHGPHRRPGRASRPRDPEKYLTAVLALLLAATIAYSIPGLLPGWVPFSRRVPGPVTPPPGFFTLGSTKPEVYNLQGPPTRVTESTWYYGSSRVSFRGNTVTGWSVSPDSPLHTGAARPSLVTGNQDALKVGSTADEVLAAQGPPDELTDTVWRYGSTEVYFRDGKVVGWKSVAGQPLKVAPAEARRGAQPLAQEVDAKRLPNDR